MGYNTNYELDIQPQPDWSRLAAMQQLRLQCDAAGVSLPAEVDVFFKEPANAFALAATNDENSSLVYALGRTLDGGQSCKWYEHEEEMRALSKQFPTLFLTLRGEGDDAGDIWVKYFKGGKMHHAKAVIEIEAFDPKKLK